MSEEKSPDAKLDRTQIIQAVQTPLGFFVLVVLVMEGILTILFISEEELRIFSFISMIVLIFSLVGLVAFLAYKRPEALFGKRYESNSKEKIMVEDESKLIEELRDEIEQLSEENEFLKNNLNAEKKFIEEKYERKIARLIEENSNIKSDLVYFTSLQTQIMGLLATGRSRSLSDIYSPFNPPTSKEVVSIENILGALGVLIQEGKITGTGSSYRIA